MIEYNKNLEYKIYTDDGYEFLCKAKFKGTGKGTLSPNKGKDVYIFDVIDKPEDFIKGQVKIGFWEVQEDRTIIEEVIKDIYFYVDLKDSKIDSEIAKYAYFELKVDLGGITTIPGFKLNNITSEQWVAGMTPKEMKLAFQYLEKGNFKKLSHIKEI